MSDRYFENKFQDYIPSQSPIINEAFIKDLIRKYVKTILQNTDPGKYEINPRTRGDIYVGLAGIAFLFLKLSKSSMKDEYPFLELAEVYANAAKETIYLSGVRKHISLLSGNAGIFVVSAAVSKALNKSPENEIKSLLKGMEIFENPEYLDDGQDEMLVGRCGFILGLQFLNRELNADVISSDAMSELGHIIIESGRNYANEKNLSIPLMFQYHGREYLGAAHGISAILFSLLSIQLNEIDAKDLKISIDCILALQNENGNFPSKFNKPDEAHLVHWCHGASGVIYLMAKAYKVYGEQKYLDSCIKCSELVWQKGLLKKGPGLCHGIASSGYVHLLLFRLTNDQKYLYRAMKFAEFLVNKIFLQEAGQPDRPFSLFEGISGTVCFLLDLLNPHESEFPFMHVL